MILGRSVKAEPGVKRELPASISSRYPLHSLEYPAFQGSNDRGIFMAQAAEPVQLNEVTLVAFADYIRQAEAGMERTLLEAFLWSDRDAERAQQIQRGQTVAQCWSGKHPVSVPDGLIHDWIGATLVPGATVERTLAVIQDYDNHKNIYKPEVIESKLISRNGNDFQIYLRLLKKRIIAVVMDTDHDVHYSGVDTMRWCCRSYSTRTAEVEDAGKPTERVMPPDTGFGFLWRLYSYWRFQERDGAVYMECRAISLTRDVPKGLGWIIEPIIRKLPRESLINTLEATRRAVS